MVPAIVGADAWSQFILIQIAWIRIKWIMASRTLFNFLSRTIVFVWRKRVMLQLRWDSCAAADGIGAEWYERVR